ncbi:hypothetical protein SERLA73DRAFT_109984 [Serpula lacrymans var. lacrymans S7.3]|uniref:Amino acid transporter transmembrane domain-containing protein n=2 Tax=Serpula lacrymans var. lacrymans TaxID=341189 RepID=F8Q003_SERL3|nr:uncharacterized protein SERLADRAFT_450345 [Serpula lacrymans var. lacrymans S7.9]EGN98475.1 hypothetical protein SERLA73DRAFT_109984 [Serpula lacrymans var. lacrymans S7.3]EGO24054.1 hypothetical protein SERLADRAFT_450345 [Serpula lacrymans var. lacrymans S7.9]
MPSSHRSSESISSPSSPSSPHSPSAYSGLVNASSSALVLLPDSEDTSQDSDPYGLFSEEETEEEQDQQPEIRRLAIPPLAPSAIFVYLLSPYLRLGAMYITSGNIPLKYALACLVSFALLSLFCRRIWYLLGRYIRKSTIEDILAEVFARGRRKRYRREIIRNVTTSVAGLLRVLLATMYLRESMDAVLPLLPEWSSLGSQVAITVASGLIVFTVSLSKSLAAKPVIFSTWLSVISYMFWLVSVAYAHAKGTLRPNPSWLQRGTLWNCITNFAFTFTTTSTVPLYASLKAGPATFASRTERSRSFTVLSISSALLAVLLLLPLTFFSAVQNMPEVNHTMFDALISILEATTLLSSIPSIIVMIPSIPISMTIRRITQVPLSKMFICLVILSLSLIPVAIAGPMSDITLFLSLAGTYLLPAVIHIITHFFRRPISIVVPPTQASEPNTPRTPQVPRPPPDLLLQRKELAMQRRRLGKRIIWDVGIWLLLIPVSTCGLIWMVGRVARQW